MNEMRHDNQFKEKHKPGDGRPRRQFWKAPHRDWRLWVVVFVMLALMAFYVVSDNLALRPGQPLHQQVPALGGN